MLELENFAYCILCVNIGVSVERENNKIIMILTLINIGDKI